MSRFNIGDEVYLATFERKAISVTCPDCFGKLKLRVILGDDTELSIDCVGCASGYDPPKGYITNYKWSASAEPKTITGIEEKLKDGKVEYTYWFPNCGDSGGKTFATKDEALARADELKAEYDAEENCRFMAKTKDHRSWAWNVTYHRQCAEKARKDLAYHENKARICAAKMNSGERKTEGR